MAMSKHEHVTAMSSIHQGGERAREGRRRGEGSDGKEGVLGGKESCSLGNMCSSIVRTVFGGEMFSVAGKKRFRFWVRFSKVIHCLRRKL